MVSLFQEKCLTLFFHPRYSLVENRCLPLEAVWIAVKAMGSANRPGLDSSTHSYQPNTLDKLGTFQFSQSPDL